MRTNAPLDIHQPHNLSNNSIDADAAIPKPICCCSRALTAITDLLTYIWDALEKCIAFLAYSCSSAETKMKQQLIADLTQFYTGDFDDSVRNNYYCKNLNAAVDKLFQTIKPYQVSAVSLVKQQDSGRSYIVFTTAGESENLKQILEQSLSSLSGRAVHDEDSMCLPLKKNQIAFCTNETPNGYSWMDSFLDPIQAQNKEN